MADDEGEIQHKPMKDMRVGSYIMIDNIPCKIVEIETSAPGKHGSAKMRVTGIGIFDGQKKSLIKTSHADADVPTIVKRKAQVVSVTDNSVQVMDNETYEVYDLPITEEFKGKLEAGKEVEVMDTMGRKALLRVWQG
ncbi:MAG: translation initiation factor IF-5A [Candidatus Micrarchaeales archaeon]